ncbi:hybrid sensor histidine kinase/response regulator [Sphingobium sp. SCG-1]|uniref:ATP-binding protein n=1 Tax=Sphingobium sp. SCG-1 TaxID=2072936 RepID=UPI000CD69CC4|nr:ATP-binding protein [Sphingobium sp. SCG-1]AUW59894.1 hybrid sensor histidine kinase/response regulator [Sphingobium sp. SCG-1]
MNEADEDVPRGRRVVRRVLAVLIGLPLIIALCALLYFASMASRDRDMALNEQRHSFEVITLANQLDASIAKAETTLARYVISTDPDIGRLFQSQWREAGAELDALTRATRRSPWQRAAVVDLREAYTDRGKTLSDIGLRTTYDQKMGALSQFHKAGKAENLKHINERLTSIIRAENARLAERSTAVNLAGDRSARANQTYQLVGLVILVGSLCAAWAAMAAWADRRNVRRLADAEMIRADMLEAAVTKRTAQLQDANIRLKQEAADRAAAEESLRQMQKMEAVGQLTGGIAHDFNNMLAVVSGGLELARRKLHENPTTAQRHLDNAMEGANRASALTRRLLAFARAEPLLPAAVDPDALIRDMVELIDRTIGDQIVVSLEPSASGWAIFVDRHQLENAILNLCVNARDAMEGKGVLTIATAQATLAPGEVGECRGGEYIRLSVKDSGCGMEPDVLQRVFEPFFTTKPAGQGTGLGLSQIFGFVRQCEGEIRILSEPGAGTQVELYLPRRAMTAAQIAEMGSAPAEPDMTDLPPTRILVVEDDPRVLSQSMDAIAELGHLPVACPQPSEATTMLERYDDVGLIVTDVLMPGMSGPEMIASLPERFRSIPVLFVTGYAGDIENADMFEGHQVLRKPYTLAVLSRSISDAIGKGAPGANGSHRSETAEAAE